MKKHFIILFDPAHRWWTISLFLLGVLLIIIASIIGVAYNLPGIILMYAGIIALFFTFLFTFLHSFFFKYQMLTCLEQ
jgi:hypothetical protein